MISPTVHLRFAATGILLGLLACRPVLAIGWDELLILFLLVIFLLWPFLLRARRGEKPDKDRQNN